MIKNSFLILSILILGAHAYADAATNYSDAELVALTERRDALKREVAACQADTKKFKIAGIATLGATGVGVYANLRLASEIRDAKEKANGGGRYGGGRGGGGPSGEGICPPNDDLCATCKDCYDVKAGSCCLFPNRKDDDKAIYDTDSSGHEWTWKGCWDEWYECERLSTECPGIRAEKGLECTAS